MDSLCLMNLKVGENYQIFNCGFGKSHLGEWGRLNCQKFNSA
jgi:hypothetical protein